MLEPDDLDRALAQEAGFQEDWITHYWDGERKLGRLVSQTLKLAVPVAWDIYLLFSPGAAWNENRMPVPTFWMHQLNERPDLLLDPDRLLAAVQQALKAAREGDSFND